MAGCRDHVPASLAFYFRRFDQPPSGYEHNTSPESFLLFMKVVIANVLDGSGFSIGCLIKATSYANSK